jgi:hypothetical protein
MEEPIHNKVAKSPLITIDLEDLKPKGIRTFLDISQWLEAGVIVREKQFRQTLKEVKWNSYSGQFIALGCSTDALIPAWASLLITTYLQPIAKEIVLGSLHDLERYLFQKELAVLPLENFIDKPIIIKGCSDPTIPQDAYIQLIQRLQPVVKSLFYGEACSSVPLMKAKKQGE